jgi:hypothetical protein
MDPEFSDRGDIWLRARKASGLFWACTVNTLLP